MQDTSVCRSAGSAPYPVDAIAPTGTVGGVREPRTRSARKRLFEGHLQEALRQPPKCAEECGGAASGAEALSQALGIIRDGRADIVVAGGAEAALNPLALAGFARLRALSRRLDDPKSASRPFDADRDGFVMGEGAGMLVVESAAHAAARGARVHGRPTGAGITDDSHHVARPAPGGTGRAAAVDAALRDAGLRPEQVRHINAHATSTPLGDLGEAQAPCTRSSPTAPFPAGSRGRFRGRRRGS
ncbi:MULTISPECIES: beta-ketoacyl synthase N-terminal-like domain-containing protein [Streptomyces]|uniref:beta-ketoacyl synthase N-terminal-like domain-containing protein n=1 Tax=Streptomyces TaxID=1883 RepID=UPI0033D50C80